MRPTQYPAASARPNLVLVGAAVTAGWYGASVGTSLLWPDSDVSSKLRIPVAGPYMALGKLGCTGRESNCTTLTVVSRALLTGLCAVGQTGGILAILEGVFVPVAPTQSERERERKRKREAASSTASKPRVAVIPAEVGPGGVGVGVYGAF